MRTCITCRKQFTRLFKQGLCLNCWHAERNSQLFSKVTAEKHKNQIDIYEALEA